MPSNTGYRQLFSHSHICAELRDRNDAVWRSSDYVQQDSDPEDIVTHSSPLMGGSITWTEDIHSIRSLQREIAEANERLEEENRIAAERTQHETQNRFRYC